MISGEIMYERDIHRSYMKIPAVLESCLDEKLMINKNYPGILPMEKCFINGRGQYWYNISGKQALDAYCKVNSIDKGFFETLILRICSQLEILEWNLIDTNCLVVDPEFIFVNSAGDEVSFVLYPDNKGNFFEELQQLMEYLLTKLNHGDKEGVHKVYRIYEMTLTKGYSIWDLKTAVLAEQQESKGMEDVYPVREVTEDMPMEALPIVQEDTDRDVYERIETKLQGLFEKLKTILRKKANKEEIPIVVRPEDEPEEEQETLHPTICLTSVLGESKGLLIYEGREDYSDFELEKDSSVIGKNPRVRIQIDRDTISQFHAKIEYFDKTYYIEDLNSTNGTYVNDEILNYKEKRALSPGDVIRFADIKYRFI